MVQLRETPTSPNRVKPLVVAKMRVLPDLDGVACWRASVLMSMVRIRLLPLISPWTDDMV